MGFVCEEGGPFRKLPTPALPGSGSRVLRSGADLSFSAPLFLCPAPSIAASAQMSSPGGHIGGRWLIFFSSGRRCWESTLQSTVPRCGQPPGRSGAANQRCTRTFPPACGPWMLPCLPGCRPCWPATRPSAICGAGRRPGANTKSRRAVQGGLCRSPVYLCRNCSSAAFSSRETCAWLIPISRATSIWVSPLR